MKKEMKLEIIPQKVFTYGDGVPAYQSGEWFGKKPNHFKGSKLILNQIRVQKHNDHPELRHFTQKYSEEYKFKPRVKKIIPRALSQDMLKFTRKKINSPKHDYIKNEGLKYFILPNVNPILSPKSKISIFQSKMHQNLAEKSLKKEYSVEDLMTTKRRIFSFDQQRNKINLANLGDKIYNCVEYSPGFFKDEGIVPGSTITVRNSKVGENKDLYNTLNFKICGLDKNKIYKVKTSQENFENDKEYVKNLYNWEQNFLGETKK